MARLATPNLGLGTWLDNEQPGAGSQTVPNTGVNGNWLTIDTSLGLQHNADGTHKANIIKGSNLTQTGGDSCVDGSTLEFSSNKIRVKDGGLTGIKCNQTAGQFVDNSTLEFNANAIRVKPLGIGTSQIADDAITGAKIADNILPMLIIASKTTGYGFLKTGEVSHANVPANIGVKMSCTALAQRMSIVSNNGSGEFHLAGGQFSVVVGSIITFSITNLATVEFYVDGVLASSTNVGFDPSGNTIVTLYLLRTNVS